MNEIRILILILAATAAFPGTASSAQPFDPAGWYLGAGIGRSKTQDLGTIDGTLAGYGITGSSAVGNSDAAWKIFGGYQINRNIAVEASYADLSKFNINSTVTAPIAGSGAGTWSATNVWSLAGVGTLPITGQLSAYGKLGIAYSSVELDYGSRGAAVNQSSSGVNPLYGIGLRYDFTRNAGMRAEWERYSNLGNNGTTGQTNVDVWSAGLEYRF